MILNVVIPNRYQDSVTLMGAAEKLRALPGVEDASLMMGTVPNLEMLADAGLLAPEGRSAGPNDLIVAMRGAEDAINAAQAQVETLLRVGTDATSRTDREEEPPYTLAAGLDLFPEANLVLISTPGIYAASEARKALQQGRHVMLFSDNITVKDEQDLKTLALQRGLLMLGPDCGTAIIGGVPLGFANVVRRGRIGVVGASGTGMQEVTSLIDRYGGGVSHAIGTGSRDLSQAVGGAMTLAGLRALSDDPATSVIVVVSKPPHPEVAAAVAQQAATAGKPVVLCFIGQQVPGVGADNSPVTAVKTLEEAARTAVEKAGALLPHEEAGREQVAGRFAPTQKYVRGLFSGGTFCYEAVMLLTEKLGEVYSNTPLTPQMRLPDVRHSTGNMCLDLGADEFTVGRPHPMIDLSTRAERILQEASDPEVAVILLDVVLGYGAHPDPASVVAGAVEAARKRAAAQGRTLAVVASICGTRADPQGLENQRNALVEGGVIVAGSNAGAARLAGELAGRTGE